jgi:hypothetical protein
LKLELLFRGSDILFSINISDFFFYLFFLLKVEKEKQTFDENIQNEGFFSSIRAKLVHGFFKQSIFSEITES